MNIEIDEFMIRPCKVAIATMLIKYHELVIKCDLVWYRKDRKYWIRMPERWVDHVRKTSYCYWPTKEISDQFQKEVLQKIFDSDMLNECEIAKIHAHGADKHAEQRNT